MFNERLFVGVMMYGGGVDCVYYILRYMDYCYWRVFIEDVGMYGWVGSEMIGWGVLVNG